MMLYAWSPNWRLNAVGHDRYELYIRRSFDGGETWTTLPASFAASDGVAYAGDGTVTCETYRTAEQQQQGDSTEPRVCNTLRRRRRRAGPQRDAASSRCGSPRSTHATPRRRRRSLSDPSYGTGYALATDEDDA